MVIYMTPENAWMDAKRWAYDHKLITKEIKQSCYRGALRGVTHVYSTDTKTQSDYKALGTEIINP